MKVPRRPRILVVRLRRIGDVLLSTPVFRALRSAYPGAALHALVSAGFEEPLRGNPHLDRVVSLPPGFAPWRAFRATCRERPYDIVIDLQGSPRSAFCVLAAAAPVRAGWRKKRLRDVLYTHRIPYGRESYAAQALLRVTAALGVAPPEDLRLDLAVSPEDRRAVRTCLRLTGLEDAARLVALSTVARDPGKRWPAAHYADLARRLVAEAGARVALTYGPGERGQALEVARLAALGREVQLFGGTTLARVAALYEHCDLWVGNDGAPKHVATAVGCPVVMVAGSYCPIRPHLPELSREQWVVPDAGPASAVGVERVWKAVSRALEGSRSACPVPRERAAGGS